MIQNYVYLFWIILKLSTLYVLLLSSFPYWEVSEQKHRNGFAYIDCVLLNDVGTANLESKKVYCI